MFLLLIIIIILILIILLAETPKPPEMKVNTEFDFPDSSMGRYVPYLFGTVKVSGNLLWYGDIHTTRIMS